GTADGGFVEPVAACTWEAQSVPRAAFLGDYDGDGLPDICIAADSGPGIFRNTGKGRFRAGIAAAGEISYEAKPDVAGGTSIDLNNDGREDLVFFYGYVAPIPFFNRGFQCFGIALEMLLRDTTLPHRDAIMEGQQAGAAGDFNGDGVQELALVTKSGNVLVLHPKLPSESSPSLSVGLPRGVPGPVNVVAYEGEHCVGVRIASASTPAFFGRTRPGPLLLKWRDPDGTEHQKRVVMLKPAHIEIGVILEEK
ncbi:MAG: VCBS repeat-containing protein, partial [Thermoguttaceae bacterium]